MDNEFYDAGLLKEQHNKLKPNVTQICRDLEISRNHYYDVINGNSCSPKLLVRLCPLLDLKYADVIRTEPVPAG